MTDKAGCDAMKWTINLTNGVYTDSAGRIRGMFNESLADEAGLSRVLPSQEYFE